MIYGFPLTRQQRDTPTGIEFTFWLVTDQGARPVTLEPGPAIFFVHTEDSAEIRAMLADLGGWQLRPLALNSFDREPVSGLYAQTLSVYREASQRISQAGLAIMEEDIRPVDRYLMERFIRTGAARVERAGQAELRPCEYTPKLSTLSLDIETRLDTSMILSIALQQGDQERVLINGQAPSEPWIESCRNERALLERFEQIVRDWDPDIFIGWNLIGFDLKVIARRAKALGLTLRLGRDSEPLYVEQGQTGRWFARFGGRVALDGVETLKGATWQFERFNLEFVAQALLGRGKKIDHPEDRGGEIQRLYREDRRALAEYNLEDCRLVTQIFARAELLVYLIERARLTGLPLDKVGGSQQAFDNLYLPQLHRQGYVAPRYASGRDDLRAPGGFVMDSKPGLYRNVLVFDFKSLYPSIIRTFSVDPLGLVTADQISEAQRVPGFHGAQFNPETAILPKIISQLWAARDRAKASGNSALSQAIKIQMNACYGVLGSRVCRFFDQRLSAAITLRGHQLLNETAQYIETELGHPVIYGDTDSVFVWLGDNSPITDKSRYGPELATRINGWLKRSLAQRYGVESALELQFESEYTRFLMPRMRHSEKGSKKRYAGLKRVGQGTDLVFKGLESVRSDWTPLAKSVQHELYRRIFNQLPWEAYLRDTVAAVYRGDRDEALLYQRRLRRPLDAYQASNPPHVKAARKLKAYLESRQRPSDLGRGDGIEYWITVNGPEPRVCRRSLIDYQHYIDKQIKPVADTILPFLGQEFSQLIAPQRDLFNDEGDADEQPTTYR